MTEAGPGPARRIRPWHVPFLTVLVLATALRVVAQSGYPTPVWVGDSVTYVNDAVHLAPSPLRPSGYSLMLWLARPFGGFGLVLAIQHLLGLLAGVMAYALMWRRGPALRPWLRGLLATALVTPFLLNADQIELEQLLMSDDLFIFFVVASVTVALWNRRASWRMGAAAGVLMAFAALTRSVGLPLVVVLVVWLLVQRSGLRVVTSLAVAFAVPTFAYMTWYDSAHGKFALTNSDQIWLYGRTADFADCQRMHPTKSIEVLCRDNEVLPPGVKAKAYTAIWENPELSQLPGGIGGNLANRRAGKFAWMAIEKQPRDYLRVTLRDTLRAFEWKKEIYPTDRTGREYAFQVTPLELTSAQKKAGDAYAHTHEQRIREPYAGWMRGYQRWISLRGTMLGMIMLVGLAGIVARWRQWGGPALAPWLMSLALLVVPAATADFDARYVLPAVPLACLAAALAWKARQPEA